MLLPVVLGDLVLTPPPEGTPNKAALPHTAGHPSLALRGGEEREETQTILQTILGIGMATCRARRLRGAAPSPREEGCGQGPRIPTTCREKPLLLLTHRQGTRTEASSRRQTAPPRLPALPTDGQEGAGNLELCPRSWALKQSPAFLPTALGVQYDYCRRAVLQIHGGHQGEGRLELISELPRVPAVQFQEP